jgi:radical SAM superfamily enzyme YgiQ (UPF0313 family)
MRNKIIIRKNKKVDIVILMLPKLSLRPIHGPFLLKAAVEQSGYKCKILDLNIDLWQRIGGGEWDYLWDMGDLTFVKKELFKIFWDECLNGIALEWIEQLKDMNPSWIGFSLFSDRNDFVARELSKLIRNKISNSRIVIGGPFVNLIGEAYKKDNIVDVYIEGEGEKLLVDLLKGNLDSCGINEKQPLQNLDIKEMIFPDYSDIDFFAYPEYRDENGIWSRKKRGLRTLHITGSRGCINNCTFCNSRTLWPFYRFRKGENIADEIIKVCKENKTVDDFYFTDCLVNGHIKELRKFCKKLIHSYEINEIKPVSLTGQFVCRKKDEVTAEDYCLIKKAGFNIMSLGIESGSERVRREMGKNFSNEDVEFILKQCIKNKIKIDILLIVGYFTETEENFQETIEFLKRFSYINKSNIVNKVLLGSTLNIIEGSYLHDAAKDLGITYDKYGNWVYKKTNNTIQIRIERWLRLKKQCLALGYPVDTREEVYLLEKLKKYKIL